MSDDNIRTAVEAAIKTQIIAAFATGPDLIEQLVAAALKEPVKTGGPYDYRTKPYLDHLITNTIQEAAKEAVREVFVSHKDEIKEAVRKRFSTETLVDTFASALIDASAQDWRINVKFEADK